MADTLNKTCKTVESGKEEITCDGKNLCAGERKHKAEKSNNTDNTCDKEKNIKIEKGEIISLKIEDMSSEGKGIGKYEGIVVFVSGAVFGDFAMVEITKVKKNFALGRAVEITEQSPFRKEAVCPYVYDCGGCSYGLINYDAQVILKENLLKSCLTKIAGIKNPKINKMITMEEPYEYRNKAVFGVSSTVEKIANNSNPKMSDFENQEGLFPFGKKWKKQIKTRNSKKILKIEIGFFRDKSRDLVDIDYCMIQAPVHEAVIRTIKAYMNEFRIPAFNEKTKRGLIKNITVRTAIGTGQVMVVINTVSDEIPGLESLAPALEEAVYDVPIYDDGPFKDVEFYLSSLVLNVTPEASKAKSATKTKSEIKTIEILGNSRIKEEIAGMKFEISPTAFYQVNPKQMVKLYEKALEYAQIKENDTVLDLYCGVGSIGLYVAKSINCQVIGIESSKEAVLDANRNAIINQVANIRFFSGKAEDMLPFLMGDKILYKPNEVNEMVERKREIEIDKVDVVILDPPRAGLHQDLIDAVVKAQPRRIVYISCDPGTLSRDIKIMEEKGYTFCEATPVDMFPETGHVETVVLMSKVK